MCVDDPENVKGSTENAESSSAIEGSMSADGAFRFEIDESAAGARVDRIVAARTGHSRAQVRRWIDAGRVRVDGVVVRPSRVVAAAESIEAWPIEPVKMVLNPEPIPLDILYEDADLIVVDKPAGLVVHPAPGHANGTLVNALLHHCGDLAGIGGVLRPGIVHRLDRGTSGVIVAAKNDVAHVGLSSQFAAHSIERRYQTFVRGLPRADDGRIDRPIGRHPKDRKRMSIVSRSGRDSITNWRVLTRYPDAGISHLEIRPESGRTHQIRVHLASAGLPLVGDVIYGRARGRDARLGRPALHAAVLGFDHPVRSERLRFEAPLPDDLCALADSLGRAVAVGPEMETDSGTEN